MSSLAIWFLIAALIGGIGYVDDQRLEALLPRDWDRLFKRIMGALLVVWCAAWFGYAAWALLAR